MKISAEKKKQMLMDSFELLKDNYDDNGRSLIDLIGKVAKLDLPAATEMWKYLVKNNRDVLHDGDDFAFSIWYGIEKAVGQEAADKIVMEDDILKKSIYVECGDLTCNPLIAIKNKVLKGELSEADELLQLVYSNKHREQSMYEILDDIIPEDDEELEEEGFDFLNEWIGKIRSKSERAKLNLKMLNFVEDED